MRASKPIPFPDEEAKKIASLDLPPATRASIRRLAAVMHAAEQFVEHMSKKKRKIRTMPPFEKISMFFFAHCYHLGQAVSELARLGHGAPCVVLVRAMLESTIDLAYLWLCKKLPGVGEEERDAWASYSDVAFNQIVEMWETMQERRRRMGLPGLSPLVDADQAAKLAQGAAEFISKFGNRKGWAKKPDLLARAQAIDDAGNLRRLGGSTLEDDYITVYKWSSQFVHGRVGASPAYIHLSEGSWSVDLAPTKSYVHTVVAMAARFMIDILLMVNHIGHWGFDVGAQLAASGFDLPPASSTSIN